MFYSNNFISDYDLIKMYNRYLKYKKQNKNNVNYKKITFSKYIQYIYGYKK